jgi:uncharacterized membrane protein
MAGWTGFVKTTVIGGIVFLVPFIVVIFILGKAFQFMRGIAQPVTAALPMIDTVGEIVLLDLLAAGLILVVCFLAGLAARAAAAGRLVKSLEARVLSRVPFYHFVKGMTESVVEAESDTTLRSVLVRLDDYSQLAFEVERLPGGDVVVFLPGAPNPWSGAVCVVAPVRESKMNAPMRPPFNKTKHRAKAAEMMLPQPPPMP